MDVGTPNWVHVATPPTAPACVLPLLLPLTHPPRCTRHTELVPLLSSLAVHPHHPFPPRPVQSLCHEQRVHACALPLLLAPLSTHCAADTLKQSLCPHPSIYAPALTHCCPSPPIPATYQQISPVAMPSRARACWYLATTGAASQQPTRCAYCNSG